ncbi:MAG TPA: hypothetical protein VN714_26425 [Trebonia sp.]|nr:hypothetical protein [Trebonia sp.]
MVLAPTAGPVAAVVGAVLAVAVGAVVLAAAVGVVLAAAADADADADGETQLASAEGLICVALPPVATANPTPTTAASTTGMATGIAMRADRLSCRRRRTDRCLIGMQSTSMT